MRRSIFLLGVCSALALTGCGDDDDASGPGGSGGSGGSSGSAGSAGADSAAPCESSIGTVAVKLDYPGMQKGDALYFVGWTEQSFKDYTLPEINERVDASGGFPLEFEFQAGATFYKGGAYLSVGTDHNDGPNPGDPLTEGIVEWTVKACETVTVEEELYDPNNVKDAGSDAATEGGTDAGLTEGGTDSGTTDAGTADAAADATADAAADATSD